MSQDLFTNPFGIPPPSDDSYVSLSRFIAEFSQAIPGDQFDSFRSKLASLHEALVSKLRGETRPRDDLSEIRGMFETFDQKFNQKFTILEHGQNSLRDGQIRLEEKLENLNINKTRSSAQRSENIINRVVAKDTKPIPFVNGQEPPIDLPELTTISDVENLNPTTQLKTYIQGYGCSYDENDPQKSLKRKLADCVGFVTYQDVLYEFSDSNENLQDIENQNSTPNRRTGRLRSRHHG